MEKQKKQLAVAFMVVLVAVVVVSVIGIIAMSNKPVTHRYFLSEGRTECKSR